LTAAGRFSAPTARGLTGWRGPGPLVKSRPTNSLLRRLPRTNSGIGRCPRNRCREPFQIEQKALTKMSAVARNIDFVGVSEEAPASGFAWVAVRVRIICCYASAIPQPICEALAELFSCRPHRAPIVYSTLRYFPRPRLRNRDVRGTPKRVQVGLRVIDTICVWNRSWAEGPAAA
jgi:hypothetical protein